MKILVTGATGQLGWDCAGVLRENHTVTAVGSGILDISDRKAIHAFVGDLKPDVIVNCAAFTRVDDCEMKKDQAFSLNTEGPKYLAAAAAACGSRIIHISTDYVFSGEKQLPDPYGEDDDTRPASCYGLTKLEGEIAVAAETDRYMILRTAWLYGANGQNFLKTMLRLAVKDPRREIKVVNDQFGSPTWSYRLAKQIEKLLKVNVKGIFHATSEGCCSWYELAKTFLDEMKIPNGVIPCATKDYPTPARRPANSILENRRLKAKGLNVMRDWRMDLEQFVGRYRDHLLSEVEQ